MMGIAGPKAPVAQYGQPVLPNLNVRQICPNCRADPPNIIEEYSKGDLVCADCGTILGDRIVDTRSEWRTFAGDEGGDDPSRVGDAGNPLLGVNNLDTMISGRDGHTGQSRDLTRAQNRANAYNHNGRTSTANLQAAFARIAEKCDVMHLGSSITTRSQHVYKIADEAKVIKGKADNVVIAACIIFACRDNKANRSFAEVSKALQVTKKDLGQVFNHIKHAVQAERTRAGGGEQYTAGIASQTDTVEGLLGRYVNYLDLSNGIFNVAKHISVQAASKTDIDGRTYPSIAAGVLFLTCVLLDKKLPPKELSEVAGVTDSTIKLICKKIALKLDNVVRPEWKTEYQKGYESLLAMAKVNEAGPAAANGGQRSSTPKANGRASTPTASANGNGNGAEKGRVDTPQRSATPQPTMSAPAVVTAGVTA